ncbi:MAG: PAS domain S-box protein, partial [candidate division Zixibacteria bacterium]
MDKKKEISEGANSNAGNSTEGISAKSNKVNKRSSDSVDRYRLFYERSPLGYQSLDDDGRLLTVNPAWQRMLGFSEKEVVGRRFCELLKKTSQAGFREYFESFRASGVVDSFSVDMVSSDGRTITVELDSAATRDESGRFIQSHGILRDVSERKRSEETLRESQTQYKQLFDSMIDGFALHELVFDESG